jgi:L-amino acid N-acyltransferase YncA
MAGSAEVVTRPMAASDWSAVEHVYSEGIATGAATFETSTPPWSAWDASHREDLRFIASIDGRVVGWVAAGPVSRRPCYAGVVEHSVYVAADQRGRGVGGVLLDRLISAAADVGVWTIQSGIFPENKPSLDLHRSRGFRIVGRREKIAQLHGTWRDVIMIERRNQVGP